MKRGLTLALVLVAGLLANAQDTIKMMQYNLLYYGNYPEWCTETDNDMNNKADYIATIIDHVKPDIFTVNEMDGSNYAAGHLLGNALNIDGTTYYSMSYPGSDYLINMMYYNSNKLELTDHYVVGTEVRDIDIYVMRSLQTADPVDFNVAVAHLKAGNEDISFRYSPGYGDLGIDIQKEILRILNAPRKIGLTASKYNILLPTKSVTAIIGVIAKTIEVEQRHCKNCLLDQECELRRKGIYCGAKN